MESVKVFSPATVANVACGYDIFGFALEGIGDEITLQKRNDSKLVITKVEGAALPLDPEKNVATVAVSGLLNKLSSRQGFNIEIKKHISPGSGLGSSASSASGAVFAANELLQRPFSKKELVQHAMQGEITASLKAHADNVAAALLGGFTVVRTYEPQPDVFQLDYPSDMKVLIVFPKIPIHTSAARKMLGEMIRLEKAREQWGNVAGLVAGLMRKDWGLIGNSMRDVVAEPVRKTLIPHYDDIKEIVLAQGAVGFNISGSGPSMFGLFRGSLDINPAIQKIKTIYDKLHIHSFFHICSINPKGTHIISA